MALATISTAITNTDSALHSPAQLWCCHPLLIMFQPPMFGLLFRLLLSGQAIKSKSSPFQLFILLCVMPAGPRESKAPLFGFSNSESLPLHGTINDVQTPCQFASWNFSCSWDVGHPGHHTGEGSLENTHLFCWQLSVALWFWKRIFADSKGQTSV